MFDIEEKVEAKFEHSYISYCVYLGFYENHDLYYAYNKIFIMRYSSDKFGFHGYDLKEVLQHGSESIIFECYLRSKSRKLI